MAEYSFPSISTTTVSSSVNSGSQPQIKFPSVLSPGDTSHDPGVSTHGLEITQNKYITISSQWTQNANSCTEFNMWLYWKAGLLGQFGAVSLKNMNVVSKYMVLKGEGTTSSMTFNIYYGTQTINVGSFKHGWHIVAFGI